MKKFLSLFLSVLMLMSITAGIDFSASAAYVSTPSAVSIYQNSLNQVTITWKSVNSATSYRVYRSYYSYKGYKAVAKVKNNKCTISNLKSDTTYYFRVKAVSGYSISNYSNIVSTWGRIKNLKHKEYNIACYCKDYGYDGGVYGYLFNFDKVSDAGALQFCSLAAYKGDKTKFKTIKNTNKIWFGSQNYLRKTMIRACKKDYYGNVIYGPWKTLSAKNHIARNAKRVTQYVGYNSNEYIYEDVYSRSTDFNLLIKGYSDLSSYIY